MHASTKRERPADSIVQVGLVIVTRDDLVKSGRSGMP
jgi:hypothetical protein